VGVYTGDYSAMTEPARPPPPKSYVPITLLEGPLVPDLPPRPQGELSGHWLPWLLFHHCTCDIAVGETERPHPQNSPPSSSVDMSKNEVVPSSAGSISEATPSSLPPTKPERHKHKQGPPRPQPYSTAQVVSGPVQHQRPREVL
jgi:hypothetical protein